MLSTPTPTYSSSNRHFSRTNLPITLTNILVRANPEATESRPFSVPLSIVESLFTLHNILRGQLTRILALH